MTGALALVVGFGGRSLSAGVNPAQVEGTYSGTSSAPQNIATALTMASGSGGRAPYTYAWSQFGASPYTWTITAPTSASTAFTAGSVGPGASADALFFCTVTDASGATAASGLVSAIANNNSTA